jgi:hypothetical protein
MRGIHLDASRGRMRRTVSVALVLGLAVTLFPGTMLPGAGFPLLRQPSSLDSPVAVIEDPFPARNNDNGQKGSGGKAVAHYAGGVRINDENVTRRAPDGRIYPVGINGWEPTIGVDDKGRVFYQARTPDLQPEVMRTTNSGDTWKAVSPNLGGVPTHPVSLDPILHVDKDTGRVFTNNIPPSLTCQPISFTDNAGKDWTNTGICGHFDHQNMFSGPPRTSPTVGYPNLVYYCAINLVMLSGSSTATTCSKSLDGGLTWVHTGGPAYLTPFPPREDQTGTICNGAVGHGFTDRKGIVYLPRVWCGQPYLAISRDEGLTWDRVQVNKTVGGVYHEAGVVADRDGNIYYTWMGRNELPYLAISRNGGKSFGKPMMIAAPGVKRGSLPAIDMGDDGKIAIVYAGSTTKSKKEADWTWNGYITMTTNALAKRPVFYSGSINDPDDPLTVGDCGSERCTTLGDFFDVAIGPDGTPWAAFVDGCPGGIKKCITTFNTVGVRGEATAGRLVGGPRLRTGGKR